MALRNNGTARSARRIAIFALLFDIVSFGFQGGLIFVAIGHDANSLTECTSTNGLCPTGGAPNPSMIPFLSNANITNLQSGTSTCTIGVGANQCSITTNYSPAFPKVPSFSYGLAASTSYPFLVQTAQTNIYSGPVPTIPSITFDKNQTTAATSIAVGGTFTVVVTPTNAHEFGVLTVYINDANTICGPSCGIAPVSTVTDTQGNTWTQSVAANAGGCPNGSQTCAQNYVRVEQWTTLVTSNTADTLTITLNGSGIIDNMMTGAHLALYNNAIGVGATGSHSQTGTVASDSVTVTTNYPNDYVVGGVGVDVAALGLCSAITPGAGQTQRGQDAACTGGITVATIESDQEEKATIAAGTVYSYSSSWTSVTTPSDDVIVATELLTGFVNTPSWALTGTFRGLYDSGTGVRTYETAANMPPIRGSTSSTLNRIEFGFLCGYYSGPGTITIKLQISSNIQVAVPIWADSSASFTAGAGSACNGIPQRASVTGPTINFGSFDPIYIRLIASCTSCGSGISISLQEAWATFSVSLLDLFNVKASSTSSSMTITANMLVPTPAGALVNFVWTAYLSDWPKWIQQPSATTELFGENNPSHRIIGNLTGYHHAQLAVTVAIAGGTGSKLWVQYSINSGISWIDLCGAGTGNPNVSITATGPILSSQCNIDTPALVNGVWLRTVGSASVSTGNPAFTEIDLLVS